MADIQVCYQRLNRGRRGGSPGPLYGLGGGLGGRAGMKSLALPPKPYFSSFPSFSTRTPMRRMSLFLGFSRRSRKGIRSFMA